jgi:hypothetical protein
MGEIAERHRQGASKLRGRFPTAYAHLSDKRWKTFRKVLETQRTVSSGSPHPPPLARPVATRNGLGTPNGITLLQSRTAA